MKFRLCIVGVGLIGGSLARALKAADACTEIVGFGRDAGELETAKALGVIDRYETDAAAAVADADIVVLSVPVGAIEQVLRELVPYVGANTVITDVGSTKASVVEAVTAVYGEVPSNFVPGHPIAGTERSGVEASFGELFQKRKVILTPLAHTDQRAIDRVRAMWSAAGAEVEEMDVLRHDEILAATSHLPHVLAFTLVDALARLDERADVFKYAAGGFRDFTRIASSDPQMWHDVCLANRQAILKMLARFEEELCALAQAVERADGSYIMEVFKRAKTTRDSFCE